MAGTNEFATEGSSYGFTCLGAAEGCHKLRPFTAGPQVRAALLGWLLALVVGAGSLLAGDKGIVTGTVAGPSKVPIPGAKLTLTSAGGSRQSVTADQTGRYSFPSVEPGSYTLVAEAAGYQVVTRADVRVTGGTSTTVDLLLEATGPPGPNQASSTPQQPSFYDDTQLKASAVKSAIDAAGYSSQAQSPKRLLTEGPSLTGNAPKTPPLEPASPEAAAVERRLHEAFQADPNSFDTNHQLGEYYLSLGNPRGGIPFLEKAQELKPGDYSNGNDLAVAYLETKSLAKAQNLLQELIRRKDTAEVHNLLGQVEEALGDATSAVNEFQAAAQMDPSEKNIFDWGNDLLLHETVEPAIEVFNRGVTLYRNSLRMYIGLGIALYSRGSYDDAIVALCHASDLNPSDPRPYLFLGKIYNVSVSQADEVARRMKRFMETNPDNASAYYYYALSSWKGARGAGQGADLAEVETLLRKSTALDPRLADAHLQLGILYDDQHREQEAIPEFQAAIRLNPDDPDAHYHLAQAYLRTGDKERSQEELQLYGKLHKRQVDEAEKRRREIQRFGIQHSKPDKTSP
jgi:tetratricopeptide (TPR) repeat protein